MVTAQFCAMLMQRTCCRGCPQEDPGAHATLRPHQGECGQPFAGERRCRMLCRLTPELCIYRLPSPAGADTACVWNTAAAAWWRHCGALCQVSCKCSHVAPRLHQAVRPTGRGTDEQVTVFLPLPGSLPCDAEDQSAAGRCLCCGEFACQSTAEQDLSTADAAAAALRFASPAPSSSRMSKVA